MDTAFAITVPRNGKLQEPVADAPALAVQPVMAHVPFCYYCEMFTVPLGAKEQCPDCGRVYPRE